MTRQLPKPAAKEEIIGQGDAVSGSDFQDLVLAVAVECGPLDVLGGARPVESSGMTLMANDKLTARISTWEAYNERTKLQIGPRGIDVSLEETRWSLVDLCLRSVSASP
jgi:hypothetical protein